MFSLCGKINVTIKDQARWIWTVVMLVIKIASNILLTGVYVSHSLAPSFLQQDIWYVKMSVQRNWRQLFLSITYFVFIAGEVWHLFLLISYLPIHELPTKYPREKLPDRKIPRRKRFGSTKNPRKKFLDPRNIHEKKFRTHEVTMARDPRDKRWHEIHGV